MKILPAGCTEAAHLRLPDAPQGGKAAGCCAATWTPEPLFYKVAVMNIVTAIIAGLLGLLLAAFALLLVAAIIFNLNIGKRYRRHLARDLDRLRLANMLRALGIDTGAWLHSERIVDIHKQMQRCSECGQTAECDDRLAGGDVDAGKIAFCDNERSLQDLLEKNKNRTSAEQ